MIPGKTGATLCHGAVPKPLDRWVWNKCNLLAWLNLEPVLDSECGTMASESCKIFVNGVPVDALQGEDVIDTIQRWDPSVAEQLRSGGRALADSRGLPTGVHTPAHGGAIFRVVSGRQVQTDDDALDDPLADA